MFGSLGTVQLQIRGFLIRLWDCALSFKEGKKNVPQQSTVRLNEEAKQTCYICNRKPINVDVVQILQF